MRCLHASECRDLYDFEWRDLHDFEFWDSYDYECRNCNATGEFLSKSCGAAPFLKKWRAHCMHNAVIRQ